MHRGSIVSTVLTPLDGKDVPLLVNGKPSGQTMGIKRIDSRHTVTVLRFQGKETGISKAEISPDGKVLKIETDYATSNPTRKTDPVLGQAVMTISSRSE